MTFQLLSRSRLAHLGKFSALTAAALVGLASQSTPIPAAPRSKHPIAIVEKSLEQVGLEEGALDRSADPCSDFYQFACGSWNDKTQIPADESGWYRSFNEIQKRNDMDLKAILEKAAANPGADAGAVQLGKFYGACTLALEATHSGDAERQLLAQADAWGKITSKDQLARAVGTAHKQGMSLLFRLAAEPDYADATQVILWIDQGGLGLPSRDDYLRDDEKSQVLREFYKGHLVRVLQLSGWPQPKAAQAALTIMALETALARISKTPVERRDPASMYNRVERKGLLDRAPLFPWSEVLAAAGLGDQTAIAVTSPVFVTGLAQLWRDTPLADLLVYVRWHHLRSYAGALSQPWQAEAFALQRAITGQPQQQPVWRRCLDETDWALGDLLGQPYVAQRFGGNSQPQAERMVQAIATAFVTNLKELKWMDAETRASAADKARKMAWLIGRPKVWRSYPWQASGQHLANLTAARQAETTRNFNKLGKLVDREEWQMSAPTVNAYYDPSKNHMVFPAGILQRPFFDAKANVPVNFGAIGMVMGHELTHGFDDEGSQFDAVGNFKQWWKPETRKDFDEKTACVVQQYDAFEALPGLHVMGKLTLGENIADIGGLRLAFAAYRAERASATEVVVASGYTEDQQFFLAHAQAWCGKMRPESLRQLVQTNPHSPPKFRVNGPLANTPEFAVAWKCKKGAPLAPVKTCAVW